MKKVISVMALVFCALSINAQILRTEELEDYAKEKYGENGWMPLRTWVASLSWTRIMP